MTSLIDLSPNYLATVERILAEHVPECEVRAFGSRAMWTAKDYSDLDLAVVGKGPLDWRKLGRLKEAFEESTLPMRVDVLDWHAISEGFRDVIEQGYVVVQESAKQATAGEWREVALGEVLTLQRGFDLPTTQRKPGSYPVIASTGPVGTHGEAMVRGPGVVIGRSGSLGGGQFIAHDFWPLNTTLWVKDFKGNDPRFCYYLLKSLDLAQFNVGSGVPTLNRNHIHPLPVPLAPLPEQRAIAHILGTLDDKIELNHRMNETLEEMARALFKSWFVDFDPVRAKMEARDTGLPQDVAALFPDRLVASELGEIPEGWEVRALPEIMDYKEGPGIRHWQYTNSAEGTRFINIRCIQDGDILLNTANRIGTEEADGKYDHFHLKEWDIVVSTSGTLGRSAIVRSSHLPLILNTSVIRFRPIGDLTSFSFLYGYLNSPIFLNELEMSASGSVQKNFGPMHLRKIRTLFPPYGCLQRYDEIAGLLVSQVIAKRAENDALATQRDTLLPRLVSGEVGDVT